MAEDPGGRGTAPGKHRKLMAAEFLFGANLPWLNYGLDFGATAWTPLGGVGRSDDRERLTRELGALAETGVTVIRWFLFCDGRAGILFDPSGRPTGLDDYVFRDIDAALEMVEHAGMTVMFVMLDFQWCRPARMIDGVQLGGHKAALVERRARGCLLDLVFRPVLERYAHASPIFAWDVMNEPEWVDHHGLRHFLDEAILLIRSCSTRPVTIGSAGTRWRRWYLDLDVDFYQVHWYESVRHQPDLETSVETLGFDRPVMLGEFPTRGSRRSWQEIVETARSAGYAGAFYWSALSQDECSDPAAVARSNAARPAGDRFRP